ncbi:MAG TPA: hypothetical protein VGC01_13090 [Mucilaginibacter sp.]
MKKLTLLTFLLSPYLLFAQEGKLKNVQTTSVWSPAKIKVDGNLSEWDDTFQAYNGTTKLFYTISNDDKYLYLVVKSIDLPNNDKIVAGGITLTINTDGKKKEKDAFSLTYPVIPRAGRGQRGAGGRGFGRQAAPPDSAAIVAAHKQTVASAKEIRVLGFKDITDTLISIYNEYSIKAAIGYDGVGNYDYELAVPLKELNISSANAKDIAYNIKVNGIEVPAIFAGANGGGQISADGGAAGGTFGGRGGGGAAGGRGGRGGGAVGGAPGGRNPEMYSPTDFWGKYTLAKK